MDDDDDDDDGNAACGHVYIIRVLEKRSNLTDLRHSRVFKE
jgi:hypothetical protein